MNIFNENRGFIATIASIFFVVAITIASEILPSIKTWIASNFGHHWIGKGILAMIFWFFIYVIPFEKPLKPSVILYSVSIGTALILVFYIFHFLGLI